MPQSILAKAAAYSSQLANIDSASQTEITRASEEQCVKIGVKLSALIEQASKDRPAVTKNSVAAAKAVVASASTGYEQFSKNAEQAAEAVASQAHNAAGKVSEQAAQAPVTATRVQ